MPMPLEIKMMEDTSVILVIIDVFWIRDVRRCDVITESAVCNAGHLTGIFGDISIALE